MVRELYNTRFFNDANLLSYYRFEGNSNDSKGSYNGTDNNISYGIDYGKFGQGAAFDAGLSSNIDIGSALQIDGLSLTISMWIKLSAEIGGESIINRSTNSTNTGVAIKYSSGYLVFELSRTAGSVTIRTVNFDTFSNLLGKWCHICAVFDSSTEVMTSYLNGFLIETNTFNYSLVGNANSVTIGADTYAAIDDLAFFSRALTSNEIRQLYQSGNIKSRHIFGRDGDAGQYPSADNSSLDSNLIAWNRLKPLLRKSVNGGKCFANDIMSTYSLVYTSNHGAAYYGGVLAPNGDIHFVPFCGEVGQKISSAGVVSTYSLIYINGDGAYNGGVLSPNGDIHFVPAYASVGQKISIDGTVSTYSLIYTFNGLNGRAYCGGALSPNGDVHFAPWSAEVGQKISTDGTVSTYSLIYSMDSAYCGTVLAPNGDIHFVPSSAVVGQKVSSDGTVLTYSLIYTRRESYSGGVLTPNGDIHFIPKCAEVGQKISMDGKILTYSLLYTSDAGPNQGGVLSPNGDIYFIPSWTNFGQKIDMDGNITTFSLAYPIGEPENSYYCGGILTANGDIHFIPFDAEVGQKISTLSAIPFDLNVCLSPFFNKF